MKIRNIAIAALAALTLGGCATGPYYRSGAGDYYYGQPTVDYNYYGYGGYGYGGGGYYGYGYGYPYSYYGYGYPYYGYAYPVYIPYHPDHVHERPRPDHPDGPDQGAGGPQYESRARNALLGAQPRGQMSDVAPSLEQNQSRYEPRSRGTPQVQPTIDARQTGTGQWTPPQRVERPAPVVLSREERAEPRFERSVPRAAPSRSMPMPRSSYRSRARTR